MNYLLLNKPPGTELPWKSTTSVDHILKWPNGEGIDSGSTTMVGSTSTVIGRNHTPTI
ncbi:MAG TPA: hypothetical protein VM103_00875 [Candidatus Paceibacterota bacterium]|nr:hypothetical protein [Candidatus Paceibacterota bacterium]